MVGAHDEFFSINIGRITPCPVSILIVCWLKDKLLMDQLVLFNEPNKIMRSEKATDHPFLEPNTLY